MRFIVAIVCFFLAAIALSVGIAQRTVWLGAAEHTASVAVAGEAPIAVVTGEALVRYEGKQTVSLVSEEPKFVAYGRADDIEAWVGDSAHLLVDVDPDTGALRTRMIEGAIGPVPNPAGGDLWLDEFSQAEAELSASFTLSLDSAMLIAVDGTEAVQAQLTMRWPRDNSTPLAGPLILGGAALGLIGLIAYLAAIAHWRRQRGPRRRTPLAPKPIRGSKAYSPGRAVVGAPSRGRRASGRAGFGAVLGAALVPMLLVGCAIGDERYIPPVAETLDAAGNPVAELPGTAVGEAQLNRILAKLKTVVDAADASRDLDLLATRVAGPAYDERTANYTMRSRRRSLAPSPQIPGGAPVFVLPEQTESWPRTVMAVVVEAGVAGDRQTMLVLEQTAPREAYKLHYAIDLLRSLPPVAASAIGAPRLSADLDLLLLPPGRAAAAYGDLLLSGEASQSYDLFDAAEDPLVEAIGVEFKEQRRKKIAGTARTTYSNNPALAPPIALSTADSGAIVAAYLVEYETVKPRGQFNEIALTGDTRLLFGRGSSIRGIEAGYGFQLLFSVPVDGDGAKIRLLGYTQGIVSAKEPR